MAKRYHNLKQWNDWLLNSQGGQLLLKEEQQVLAKMVAHATFNKYVTLIGMPAQETLLQAVQGLHQFIISSQKKMGTIQYVEADYQELPISSGQIDFVVLPHTLEWVEHPRQLLHEACRIIKPEGLIAVFGFNPHSLYKLTQMWHKKKGIPWRAEFLPLNELKKWMELAGFQIESTYSFMYRPLSKYSYIFDHFPFLEWIGKNVFPYYGGVYALLARAKEIPLTPIKMQWKQQLGNVRMPSAVSGHTIHDGIQ